MYYSHIIAHQVCWIIYDCNSLTLYAGDPSLNRTHHQEWHVNVVLLNSTEFCSRGSCCSLVVFTGSMHDFETGPILKLPSHTSAYVGI